MKQTKHGWSKRREARVLIRHLITSLKQTYCMIPFLAMEVVYYSSCTFRSSENICSSSGGALEKGETQWNSFTTKIDGFLSFIPRLNANVLFLQVFKKKISPYVWPNLRVLVLCFSYFTNNSNIPSQCFCCRHMVHFLSRLQDQIYNIYWWKLALCTIELTIFHPSNASNKKKLTKTCSSQWFNFLISHLEDPTPRIIEHIKIRYEWTMSSVNITSIREVWM
jgi:hypothetical protein